jgi:methyl-accepting chemotaxis protein
MKNPASMSKKSKNLHARLVQTFSIMFVFCVLALSLFLFSILQLISFNNQIQTRYQENQHIYQLEHMLRQYHLMLKSYTISSSPISAERLSVLERRIDESLQNLQEQQTTSDPATFETLTRQNIEIQTLTAQIIEAVDEQDALEYNQQDWSEPASLSLKANNDFDILYATLRAIRTGVQEELDTLTIFAQIFSLIVLSIGMLTIPTFAVLGLLVAVIIYTQINLPFEQLTQAAQDLQQRQFNPETISHLLSRNNEIGTLANEFRQMAGMVEQRAEKLQQEAEEIRAKIRHSQSR